MPAHRTARERARAELTAEIKDEARRQLADNGANGLSLRAVARELGMVSSALYRYFPSRDELLTALIVDAYNALGDTLDTASASDGTPADRWRAAADALRTWARAHPYEYALLYGTPVPGYRAPHDTVAPAGRVPGAFLRIARDAWHAGDLRADGAEPDDTLRTQARTIATALDLSGLPEVVILRAVDAWTQLFGTVALEFTGQFANTLDPADVYFARTVELQLRTAGLA
ncbi:MULTISPECIES: TetR/AcrR family transcriptional regulator [Prauserella salsuginis group]|uniref:TetR/AcrR family transcriptional regulator n=1 Tax=Prauserella salsuginis TaxID=387889 RepID=A0ABW6FYZ1_9PSEU|nr:MULTISPECIES: TetR/AcrR family transcriptional regulator [Prauserella salsuginis group]MCR3721011.1 transcriptional regulator, TetR family [Prauserella flava]MCR3734908.1 transcriptional regulator, TetR family [Prauserella salsuginis]